MKKKSNDKLKLGLLVVFSFVFFVTVYFIGKSQNLFANTFDLQVKFNNASGLNIGNKVLLSGINI